MNNAVIVYARVSTTKQDLSPDVQVEACRAWAEARGYRQPAMYFAQGGSSVRGMSKAEIDQRELRRTVELAQQADRVQARIADQDLEVLVEGVGKRVGNELIVVDDQQPRSAFRR